MSSQFADIRRYAQLLADYIYQLLQPNGNFRRTFRDAQRVRSFIQRHLLQKDQHSEFEGTKDILFGVPFLNKMRFQTFNTIATERQLEERLKIIVSQYDNINIYAQRQQMMMEVARQDYALSRYPQPIQNVVLNSPLASQLSYYLANMMPRDVRVQSTRSGRGFNYSRFLGVALRNLDYNPYLIMQSFNMDPTNPALLIRDILTLDEQLSDLLISPNTFFLVYSMMLVVTGDIQDEDIQARYDITEYEIMQRIVFLSIQACVNLMRTIRQNGYDVFRPIDIMFQGIVEQDVQNLGINFNQVLNRNIERDMQSFPEGYMDVINNTRVTGPAYFTQIALEASSIFDPETGRLKIHKKTNLEPPLSLRNELIQTVLLAIDEEFQEAQVNMWRIGTHISKQFKQIFSYIYLTFIESLRSYNIERTQQGQLDQNITRIDLFFELLSYKAVRGGDWRGEDLQEINDNKVNNKKDYQTYRFSIRVIPDERRQVMSAAELVDQVADVYMETYIGWMIKYGNDEDAEAFLRDFQRDPRMDYCVERVTMKPMIWFQEQESIAEQVSTSRAYQQFLNQNMFFRTARQMNAQNAINQNVVASTNVLDPRNKISLFGFLTYKEYVADRLFIDDNYDQERFLYHKLLTEPTCINCVMCALIFQFRKDDFEAFLDILNTKSFQDFAQIQLNEFYNEFRLKNYSDGDLLLKLIQIFELEREVKVIYDYQVDSKSQNRINILIFMNHVFIADYEKLNNFQRFQDNQNKSLDEIQMIMNNNKIKNVSKCVTKKQFRMYGIDTDDRFGLKSKNEGDLKQIKALQIYKSQNLYARVYFDFETTYLENDQFLQKKLINKDNAFDQVSFCVSYLREINFNLNAYIDKLKKVIPYLGKVFQYISFENFSLKDETALVIWQLNSEQKLIRIIEEIEFKIQQQVQQFNEILIGAAEQMKGTINMKNLNGLLLNSNVICMSYNGAKFDNHFIIRGYKMLYPLDWSHKLKITGSFSDIKILQVGHIIFNDLLLMTGAGCSLKKLAQAMQIAQSKIDLKIEEVAPTYEKAQENKEEIIKYCARDTDLLIQIFNKFRVTIGDIIVQFILSEIKEDSDQLKAIEDFKQIAQKNLDLDISECAIILHQLGDWATISSLSLKIYKQYFCEQFTAGVTDKDAYKSFKNSYFGGFTQAFWIGENRDDERVRYLDFNSMYPYIMASLKFPVDFSYSNYRSMESNPLLISSLQEFKDFLKLDKVTLEQFAVDPLTRNNENQFMLNQEFGDYNLFTIKAFEFYQDVFSPQIPVRTKNYGTIYPIQFDVRLVKDLQDQIKDGIPVFGFKLRKLLLQKQLKGVIITGVTYIANRKMEPVFAKFDNFLYSKRSAIKKENPVMAQCIKILLNSLYGKFGQSVFPITFLLNENEYHDQNVFIQKVFQNLKQDKTVDQSKVTYNKMDKESLQNMNIKVDAIKENLFGIQNHYTVELTNAPQIVNGSGGLVYWASLITDVGRSLINDVIILSLGQQKINGYEKMDARVYYCDTDSVILNEIAYNNLLKSEKVLIDNVILGGLKDEYPDSVLKEIRILNKKVYQYKINGEWINKFKGVKNPEDSFYERLKNTGSFKTKQTKFSKKLGAVSIVKNLDMLICQRLARKIKSEDRRIKQYNELDSCQGNYTLPYQNVSDFYNDYNNKSGVKYQWDRFNWEIF